MKILIATGGTGGHIFPAIETAKALKVRGHQVSFAGVLGSTEEKIRALEFPVYSLSAQGLHDRSFLGWMIFSRIMFQAIFRSFSVIRKAAPDKTAKSPGAWQSQPGIRGGFRPHFRPDRPSPSPRSGPLCSASQFVTPQFPTIPCLLLGGRFGVETGPPSRRRHGCRPAGYRYSH